MQTLSKLTFRQWAALLLVFILPAVCLWGLPAGAQEESPASEAETSPTAEDPDSETKPPMPAAPEAKKLFEEARRKIAGRMYRAKIVQKIHFAERSLEATGQIIQGDKYRVRLEFQIKSGPTVGRLLQVSNGDKLWIERRVNDVPRLTVQDVKEILTKAGAAEQNMVVAEMGLGGITALLASMDRTLNFGKPERVEVDGEPLHKVDGVWNERFLNRMKANPQLGKGLPEYIPDGARVYFDRDEFPRRIQYLKKEKEHNVLRPIVTIDFVDVEWLTEADVKPSLFEYVPPDKVYPEEVTKNYLDLLEPRSAAPPGGPPTP